MKKLLDNNVKNLSEELFNKFARLIYKEAGIYLKPSKNILVSNRLRKRIKKLDLNSYDEYYDFLLTNKKEIINFINAISTNETYFFRNLKQMNALKNTILPMISKKNEKVKIWSAGCSTGEEPYSLSIISDMLKLNNKVEIIASDINTEVIKEAKQGIYGIRKLRGLEDKTIKKYFKKDINDKYILDKKVKSNIEFKRLNLMSDKYIDDVDILFCRNVMIYFDRETQKKIVEKFYNSIKKKGFLFLGHAETLYIINNQFKYMKIDDASVYYKDEV